MRFASGAMQAFLASSPSIPDGESWMGPRERQHLAGLGFPKRRRDWRLGRWAAKHAVRAALSRGGGAAPELDRIEIVSAPDGAPEVLVGGEAPALAVSLSHGGGLGLAVVAESGASPGCDVESVEPRDPRFVEDYFTPEEARLVSAFPAAERDLMVTVVWSAKESALKALRQGLRRDTRSVDVRIEEGSASSAWRPLLVSCLETGRIFRGGWRRTGECVLTVVRAETPGAAAGRA